MTLPALEYPVATPPAVGGGIVPLGVGGVSWLRLPVPGSLKHINLWLLEDGDGYTLVDTGMNVPEARAAWEGPVHEWLGGRPVHRIVCTHHHPDHAGLAAWLQARFGAPVYMSEPEERLLRDLLDGARTRSEAQARLAAFAADGLASDEALYRVMSFDGYRRVMSGVPTDLRRLDDGGTFEAGGVRWVAHLVRGHTDGQLVLHAPSAGLLIAGDQILPRITSNVGIYPERADRNPLASFLGSFAALEAIEPEPLVLPSHGDVFRGLRTRIAQLRAHHAATLDTIRREIASPATAAELAGRLYRSPLDPLNRMLAIGETLAHLEYLVARGEARVAQSPDGWRRYGPP